ncbi:DUF3137 domain-containing protein [bacterium]|nr:DUF3137 domain-containing protein [bacterium]
MAQGDPLSDLLDSVPKEFAFFRDRYRTAIAPALQAREADRQAMVSEARKFRAIGALGGVIAAGLVWLFTKSLAGLIVGGIVFVLFAAYGGRKFDALRKELKALLVLPIATQFDLTYEAKPGLRPRISDFRSLGLIGSWDRAKFEDRMTGVRNDLAFEFFEAHLEEKRTSTDSKGRTTTTWVTIFKGQCVIVDFERPFQGVTKIVRDAGVFNMLTGIGQKFGQTSAERVRLEDPVFEKAFEVYSTDQIEARYLLTPDFMQRLVDLETAFRGKQLRCAFAEGEMLVAVEGKNQFEPGSLYKPLDDPERVAAILKDFLALFRLLDEVRFRRADTDAETER